MSVSDIRDLGKSPYTFYEYLISLTPSDGSPRPNLDL